MYTIVRYSVCTSVVIINCTFVYENKILYCVQNCKCTGQYWKATDNHSSVTKNVWHLC